MFEFLSDKFCPHAMIVTPSWNKREPCVCCWYIFSPGSWYHCASGGVISINETWRRVDVSADTITPQPIVQRCGSQHNLGSFLGVQLNWRLENPPAFCQNPKSIFRYPPLSGQPDIKKWLQLIYDNLKLQDYSLHDKKEAWKNHQRQKFWGILKQIHHFFAFQINCLYIAPLCLMYNMGITCLLEIYWFLCTQKWLSVIKLKLTGINTFL